MAASITYTIDATYTDGDFVTSTMTHTGTVTNEAVSAGKWVVTNGETDDDILLPITRAKMIILLPDQDIKVKLDGSSQDMAAPANQVSVLHLDMDQFRLINNSGSDAEVKFWVIGTKD